MDQLALNRFLLIPKVLILVARVDCGTPSLVAAPRGPATRPPHSTKARSIISFSWLSRDSASLWRETGDGTDCLDNQLSSTEKVSRSHNITDRSTTFCSSRTFPGHE